MDCMQGMLKYVDNLERDFHHLYSEVGREPASRTIHLLRLNLKKQRALFRLLEFLDAGFSAERALEAYGKLYKKLGKVRNLQVEQQVIRRDEAMLKLEPRFSEWLSRQELERRQQLAAFASSFSMVRLRRLFSLVKNRLGYIDHEKWKPGLNVYFNQCFDRLRSYGLSAPGREIHYHECRRQVKEIAYNLDLVQGLCEESTFQKEPLQGLDAFQDILGAWHDRFYCLLHISEEQEQCPPAMVNQLRAEQIVLARRIEEHLDQLEDTLNELERAWSNVMAHENVKPVHRAEGKQKARNTRPAFGQLNVHEGTK